MLLKCHPSNNHSHHVRFSQSAAHKLTIAAFIECLDSVPAAIKSRSDEAMRYSWVRFLRPAGAIDKFFTRTLLTRQRPQSLTSAKEVKQPASISRSVERYRPLPSPGKLLMARTVCPSQISALGFNDMRARELNL